MIDKNRCPLCGNQYKEKENACSRQSAPWGDKLTCNHYNRSCVVHDSVEYISSGESTPDVYKRYNYMVSLLLRQPYASKNRRLFWKFFYEEGTIGEPIDDPEKFNVANAMMDYPHSFQQCVDKVLLALSLHYPTMGYHISICGYDRALYYVTNNNPVENASEIRGMLDCLTELGYLRIHESGAYEFTAKGWIYVGELSKLSNEINQGFIAMAFRNETQAIGEAFHDAISSCGYVPRRIDQKEHNNQIVPEIFYEIKRSKFLVADVTYPNYGAYYEAGYGEALNKQVIVCCRQDIFSSKDKPHFDIAQKSTVVWSDIDDLKQKLKTRIEATVGLGKTN